MSEYSYFKAVHHTDRMDAIKRSKQIAPVHVHLVVTNRCNHNCLICAYRLAGYSSNESFDRSDQMPLGKVIETLDCLKDMDVQAVQFTGGGEPLVHPNIEQIIKATIDREIKFAIVTNGAQLTPAIIELMPYASWVRISLDAATHETYSMVHGTNQSDFERVVVNIGEISHDRNRPEILGVSFVINRENYQEISAAAKLARDLWADNFRISAAFTPQGRGYFAGIEDWITQQCDEADELLNEHFKVINLWPDRLKDTEEMPDYSYCPTKEFVTYIGADQNVYLCCMLAYNGKGLIGSIKNNSFKELWENVGKREQFNYHNPLIDCRLTCMYNQKNRFINYCLDNNPAHVEFV